MDAATVGAIAVWIVVALFVVAAVRRFRHRRKLKALGDVEYAEVTYISGTGSYMNGNPDCMITLTFTATDGQDYRKDFTTNFNMAQMPRRGDRIKIWVDPNNLADFEIADKSPIPPGFNA